MAPARMSPPPSLIPITKRMTSSVRVDPSNPAVLLTHSTDELNRTTNDDHQGVMRGRRSSIRPGAGMIRTRCMLGRRLRSIGLRLR